MVANLSSWQQSERLNPGSPEEASASGTFGQWSATMQNSIAVITMPLPDVAVSLPDQNCQPSGTATVDVNVDLLLQTPPPFPPIAVISIAFSAPEPGMVIEAVVQALLQTWCNDNVQVFIDFLGSLGS